MCFCPTCISWGRQALLCSLASAFQQKRLQHQAKFDEIPKYSLKKTRCWLEYIILWTCTTSLHRNLLFKICLKWKSNLRPWLKERRVNLTMKGCWHLTRFLWIYLTLIVSAITPNSIFFWKILTFFLSICARILSCLNMNVHRSYNDSKAETDM